MTKRIRIAGLCIASVGALAILWQSGFFNAASVPKKRAQDGVPVRITRSKVQDAKTYLTTIATVQAFNTVLVRARVDGEISRVAFGEGKNVKRGEVLVELDRRPLEAQLRSAIAQREKDKALRENAMQDVARYEFLVPSGSAPSQLLDTARALVHQLDATIEADGAQIDLARLQVTYATIRSPIDGRAGARLVDVGNLVHPNDSNGLVVLTQTRPIAVSFSLPQRILPVLRAQQAQHPVRVEAFAQDSPQLLGKGELTLIDNQIDNTTATIRCKATFENPEEALWPGQFVMARLVMDTLPNAVSVPTIAVQMGAQGPYVYVIKDNVAKVRAVTVGQASDDETVVISGLSGGEVVVIEGQFQLTPDARVVVKASESTERSVP